MSTTALDTQDAHDSRKTAGTAGRHAGGQQVTFPRVVHMEWIKLRSLRSTLYTLAITVALVIGFGLLFSSVVGSGDGPGEDDFGDPTSISLGGVMLAALAVAVLGVLMSAGEYATGSIRATLAAVPSRLPVLWGKVTVFAVVSFALMLVAVLGPSWPVSRSCPPAVWTPPRCLIQGCSGRWPARRSTSPEPV